MNKNRMGRYALALATTAFLVDGCSPGIDEWMPMKVNRTWTYRIHAGFERHTVPVRVSRQINVAATDGFELASTFGVSRLAWKSNCLVAESTANCRFSPPVPMLYPRVTFVKGRPKAMPNWHGRIQVMGIERPASATLIESPAALELGLRKVQTVHSLLTITLPEVNDPGYLRPAKMELDSWYQSGVGLVQQEQRTNDNLVVQLTIVKHS
ncbi:MAG: hypothetical protein P4L46_09555 [Fimbriimonas sp.]|nr:hypothetical protein [Fimbriimonas sp.]